RRRHTRFSRDWSSDVCSSDLLVAIDAGAGDALFIHVPHPGNVGAMLGVGDVTSAGELVRLLPVFASALAVGLTGDGGVTTVGARSEERRVGKECRKAGLSDK